MLGAIAGDIIGSVYERHPIKTTDFPLFNPRCRFTDDSVMSIAVAVALMDEADYTATMQHYGNCYRKAGYGGGFRQWLMNPAPTPYNSWGNGSAMRVSPVGFACPTMDAVMEEAERSAAVTHNHPEGIKGAQATALAIFLARSDANKDVIKEMITTAFGYDLDRTLDEIRPSYHFDVSCQGTVPESIIAFLESTDYEDAIRKAISLGGDSDTLACITGGIAEAYYREIPEAIVQFVQAKLTGELYDALQRFQRFANLQVAP